MKCTTSVNGLTNVVQSIMYRVTDTVVINGETHEVLGSSTIQLPDPNPVEFTPFETLTEETVTAWVVANADIDAMMSRLTANLETRLNKPTVVMTPPWLG